MFRVHNSYTQLFILCQGIYISSPNMLCIAESLIELFTICFCLFYLEVDIFSYLFPSKRTSSQLTSSALDSWWTSSFNFFFFFFNFNLEDHLDWHLVSVLPFILLKTLCRQFHVFNLSFFWNLSWGFLMILLFFWNSNLDYYLV